MKVTKQYGKDGRRIRYNWKTGRAGGQSGVSSRTRRRAAEKVARMQRKSADAN